MGRQYTPSVGTSAVPLSSDVPFFEQAAILTGTVQVTKATPIDVHSVTFNLTVTDSVSHVDDTMSIDTSAATNVGELLALIQDGIREGSTSPQGQRFSATIDASGYVALTMPHLRAPSVSLFYAPDVSDDDNALVDIGINDWDGGVGGWTSVYDEFISLLFKGTAKAVARLAPIISLVNAGTLTINGQDVDLSVGDDHFVVLTKLNDVVPAAAEDGRPFSAVPVNNQIEIAGDVIGDPANLNFSSLEFTGPPELLAELGVDPEYYPAQLNNAVQQLLMDVADIKRQMT